MRIISQTGRDYPYEHIVVGVEENRVECRPVNDLYGRDFTLGTYKDFETAHEVFCMIRGTYLDKLPGQSCVFEMPEEDYETESY